MSLESETISKKAVFSDGDLSLIVTQSSVDPTPFYRLAREGHGENLGAIRLNYQEMFFAKELFREALDLGNLFPTRRPQ
jgi:hypothetical protein